MGIAGGPYIIRDSSLVLELDASDLNSYVSGSTTWYDLSGTSNNTQGTLTYQAINNINTLYFSGSQFASSANQLTTVNGGITLEGFVYLSNTSAPQGLVGYRNGASIFALGVDGTPKVYTQTSGSFVVLSITPLSFNSWWHLVAVNSGSFTLVYVNGKLDNSASTVAMPAIASSATVGRWVGGNLYSIGNVANVKVYNRPLTSDEILQNYNALKSRFGLT